VFAPLFHAEQIEVIPPSVDALEAGATTPVEFTIRNFGPAVRLNLTATDNRGKVLTVDPAILQLETETDGAATVRVTVPSEAAADSEVSVLVTASGISPSPALNYARKQFAVNRK
jgi:hypothetical protein